MREGSILTLVRHGETSANIEHVWHGSTDTALTDRGVAQAERVGRRFGDDYADSVAIYSSPLRRAHETAQAIGRALGRTPQLESGLREYDLGRWEGRPYQELAQQERFWEKIQQDPEFAPHGGESPRQVAHRLTQTLRRLSDTHRGERIVIVTHGGALSMALGAFLDGDYTRWHRVMHNCAVSELVLDPEPELLSFNRTEHLEGL